MKRMVMILAVFSFVFVAKSSFAWFDVCNSRSSAAWVAFEWPQYSAQNMNDGCVPTSISGGSGCSYDDWLVNGWWRVSPGQCVTVYGSSLNNRYYYLHAEFDDGARIVGSYVDRIEDPAFAWDEDFFGYNGGTNCIEKDPTGTIGTDSCTAGYQGGFRQIDTGTTATNFTYTMHN